MKSEQRIPKTSRGIFSGMASGPSPGLASGSALVRAARGPVTRPLVLKGILFLLAVALAAPVSGAVRINSISCPNSTVSKGQTGIVVIMEVENLDTINPTTMSLATLTFGLGRYEVTLNTPTLPAVIPASQKVSCMFTLSVHPLSDSGVCIVDGSVQTAPGGNDTGADVTHTWTVQQPSELVITSILGPSQVNRGSTANQAIMDVSRSGEADVEVNHIDLAPLVPSNYSGWTMTSPTLPKNFTQGAWWNTRWPYRRQLTIGNRSPSTLPAGYEIKFQFDHASLVSAGKSLTSGDDIRIVYFNGAIFQEIARFRDPLSKNYVGPLRYTDSVVESNWNATDTKIWFRLQAPLGPSPSSTRDYAIYYGANAADAVNPPANPKNVFLFDDDVETVNGWTSLAGAGMPGGYADRWERGRDNAGDDLADEDGAGPINARTGLNYWGTDADNTYDNPNVPTSEIMVLRSPVINLANTLNPTLTFWDTLDVETSVPPGAYDFGRLRVVDPNTFALIKNLEATYGQGKEHGGWQKQTYNLSEWAGSSIRLEYAFYIDWAVNAFGWCVDDLRIRNVAVPEPNNPSWGVEEPVPLVPTIKAYFDVDVDDNAVAGADTIDGIASGTESNTGGTVADDSAAVPLTWTILGQDFITYGNPYYLSPKATFNAGETVYGKGKGYNPGMTYIIRWFNPSDQEVASATLYPSSDGNLYHSHVMSASDPSGRWTIHVENPAGSVRYAEITFDLNIPAQLVSNFTMPSTMVCGQAFTLTERVSNGGQTQAIGVTPSALTPIGGATYGDFNGPIPSAQNIPGGESRTFTWTGVALTPGFLVFRGNASGTMEGSTVQTVSASASSNVCIVRQEGFSVTTVAAPDTNVNRGQTGLPVTVALSNTGTSELSVASIALIFKQGVTDYSALFPNTLVTPSLPVTLKGGLYPPWSAAHAAFTYRQKLTLTAGSTIFAAGCTSRALTDTDALVTSGKLQADKDDWRVVKWDDTTQSWTELNRFLENAKSTAFRLTADILPYSADESYYVYYGNAGAGAGLTNRANCYLHFQNWETPNTYPVGITPASPGFPNGAMADFPGWTVQRPARGVFISDSQGWEIGAQALMFRYCDTPWVRCFYTMDATRFPDLKVSFNRLYANCENNDDFEFGVYNPLWNYVMNYSGWGPDDGVWHLEEFNLSSFPKTAAFQISFETNFSAGGETGNNRLAIDDVTIWMDGPQSQGAGEETQPVTTMTATFTVSIDLGAPTGVVNIDASATAIDINATGTITDPAATTLWAWTIGNRVVKTYADAGATQLKDSFSRGQTVVASASGLTPSVATVVRWYDAYTGGTLRFTDNVTTTAGGVLPLPLPNHAPLGTHLSGVWRIAISQGGSQVATGSFQLLEKPDLFPLFDLSPSVSMVGESMTATLTVHASPMADGFQNDVAGLAPANWTCAGGGILVDNGAAYADNPRTNYVHITRAAAGTSTLTRAVRLQGVYSITLNFDHSLVFANPSSLQVLVSANGGGAWTPLTTYSTSVAAGTWSRVSVPLPATVENNPNAMLRFSFTSGAGTNHACLDQIYLSATSANHESVILEPVTWVKDTSSSGDATVISDPVPTLTTVSCGNPVQFTATYRPTTTTAAGQMFRLFGVGAPRRLASGTSLADGTTNDVPDSPSKGVEIFEEKFSIAPPLVDLGSTEPANTSPWGNLTVTNSGNFNLDAVRWEFYNLASDPYFIPLSAITGNPDPLPSLIVGANTGGQVRVSVPPATIAGTYTSQQFVFEDNDLDGNSIGEPIGTFALRVYVPQVEKLQPGTTTMFLGSWVPGDQTATASLMVSNIGNVNLNIVRLLVSNFVSGGNTIANTNVTIQPTAVGMLAKGASAWETFSVKIPAGQPAGTYNGTGTYLDDKDADGMVDPGEASGTTSLSLIVGATEVFTVGSATVSMPDTAPGLTAVQGWVRIRNTGSIPLENIKFEFHDLNRPSKPPIGSAFISIDPGTIPTIAPGAEKLFRVYVIVPFGVEESAGSAQIYSGMQYVYNDKNKNGIRDGTEVGKSVGFTLEIDVLESENFAIAEEIANFGSSLPNTTRDCTLDVVNVGNWKCQHMRWVILSPLTKGVDTIPNPTFLPATNWTLNFPTVTHQIATLTITIPFGQAAGNYVGRGLLYVDSNNNNTVDATEASDTFEMRVEVGVDGVDILETSPLYLGEAPPGTVTSPIFFSVKNIGERTLTNLKYLKYDLEKAAATSITPANQIYSAPDPIGLLATGVTWTPTIQISVPPGQPDGVYAQATPLMVFQDDDDDGIHDATEVYDTILCQVKVLLKAVMSLSPTTLDMGGVTRGEVVTKNFTITNLGNLDLNLRWTLPDLADGGNKITADKLLLTAPETPWNIPFPGTPSEVGSLKVTTALTTPTGVYQGKIFFWHDADLNGSYDTGEESWEILVKIAVGEKALDVLNATLDFGNVQKGNDSSSLVFTVRNTGTVFLSNTRIASAPLVGPGTIPTTDLHFTTTQITPPNLNPGVTRDISLYIHTAGTLPSGIYSGTQRVYEDLDGDGVFDAGEPSDTFVAKVLVTSGGALSYEMISDPSVLDFGDMVRGSQASQAYLIRNVCGNTLTDIRYNRAALVSGGNTIGTSNIGFTPNPGFSIPPVSIMNATAGLTIPTAQPAGAYSAVQWIYDDDHLPDASTSLLLSVTVPPASITITPKPISGTVQAGSNATFPFVVSNKGIQPFLPDCAKTDLEGPGYTIPLSEIYISYDLVGALNAGLSCPASVGVVVPLAANAGDYIATLTFFDSAFPNEASFTLNLLIHVPLKGPQGLASGTLFQEVATSVFPLVTGVAEHYILSVTVCPGTGTGEIGFLQTDQYGVQVGYSGVSIASTGAVTPFGPLLGFYGVADSFTLQNPSFGLLPWFRLYFTFDYKHDDSVSSHTYILLKNANPDAAQKRVVFFDGLQLEKGFAGQAKPTAFNKGKKLISPNQRLELKGEKAYYEW